MHDGDDGMGEGRYPEEIPIMKNAANRKALFTWLLSCLVIVALMVSVGGITRLTRSGLSITEWKPVTGIVPPLTEGQWQREFDLYRRSPEFHKVNSHFQLGDYKKIFWWEFIHRALGRFIFFWVALGGLVFWRRGQVSSRFALGLPALIAFQGLMGWLMVKSGLSLRPAVSHYLLSVHFFLALATLVAIYREITRFKKPLGVSLRPGQAGLLLSLGAVYAVQVLYGCFTSGLKAGLYFNTYPLMGGEILPGSAFHLAPLLSNFFENPVMVQWIHRWLGTFSALFTLGTAAYFLKAAPGLLRPYLHLVSVVLIQVFLGLATLLWKVPVSTAAAHQFMAILVVLGFFNIAFRVQWPGWGFKGLFAGTRGFRGAAVRLSKAPASLRIE
jgi:cytochrome c oxidase assembly protein subunit 15